MSARMPFGRQSALRVGSAALIAGAVLGVAGVGTLAPSAGASGKLTGPIKLAFMWQIKGESSYAIDTFQYGAVLALNQINKAGGVDGAKLKYTRYPSTPVTSSQATSEYISAAAGKPAVMFGPPGPIAQVLVRYETEDKIPVLSTNTTTTSAVGKKFGTMWRFNPYPSGESIGSNEVKYLVDSLHIKTIGIIGSTDGSDGPIVNAMEAEIKTLGANLTAFKTIAVTSTDATGQVLGMQGAGAILITTYPNPMNATANQIAQDGLTVPVMTDTRVLQGITSGVVKATAAKHIYEVTGCPLVGAISAKAKKFITAYKAKYGETPTPASAESYDEVYLAATAIKKAGTTNAAAIQKVLAHDSFTGGVCTSSYKSNAGHTMTHSGAIYSFATPSNPKVVDHYSTS